ncbi:GNAT family N-acetyltransferase [Thalassobius sp. S69A]|uniref:GNAT family N-acetyltransferase n=1 Tax=unclassified Thalassovita TaxID=2619711 RepID=UPI000C10CE9B|nr:GNAT family N-acetyltransferase [Paracoccaceae bacterium]MBT24918.1 GNAT family N-acetyltransferase [Paracoccaceae bacterium]
MIRALLPSDYFQVAALMGRSYKRSYEAWLVQALREAGDIAAELVWEDGGKVHGHVSLTRHRHPPAWFILSSIAVSPERRGQGIGSDLVRAILDEARKVDAGAVTVLGNARYYQRFGFTRSSAEALETPFSRENTLLYPIRSENAGIMAELVYPAAYSRL